MLTPGADPSLPDSGILTGTLDVCTHGIVFESDGMGPFPVSITRDVDRLRLLSGSDAISALGAVLPLPSSVSPAAAKQWQAVTRSWVIHHDFDDAVEAMGQ